MLGIDPADIATYVGTLTPMQLRADTRVTNHGFVDGHATSLQSVLQAGTAVLVDDHGRPRVKCGCGNPLLDPVATPITPVLHRRRLARLQPPQRLRRQRRRQCRSTGSSSTTCGRARRSTGRAAPTATRTSRRRRSRCDDATPTPTPCPTVVACPSGTHLERHDLRRERARRVPERAGP